MATIKAYTDLEQSKKLAKILPLESADMKWFFWKEEIDAPKTPTFGYSKAAAESYKDTEAVYLACWSLASLLGVLPKRIELEGVAYELSIYLNGLYYWNVNNGNLLLEVKGKDNLVDACVDMIEKLHELKML